MNKNKIYSAVLGIFLLAPLISLAAGTFVPSEEQLVDLTKPAVVRIVNQISGQITVPAFDIDLNNLQSVFLTNKPPVVVPVDTTLTGSGFSVNPNGYIVTNSHVVASSSVEDDILGEIWLNALYKKIASLTQAQAEQARKNFQTKYGDLSESDYEKIGNQILKPLKQQSILEVSANLTVLKPSAADNTLKELVKDGFKAELISFNPEFDKDQRDVALIKIQQTNLPTLPLAKVSSLIAGQKVFVFSYPSTATFNSKDFLEPSFTSGLISAIKNSDSGDFKIFQTDAKISTGSSGSPLIDSQGQVNAVITFETGSGGGSQGDNFAFALPIELANAMLEKAGVTNDTGSFYEPFLQGLSLQSQRHCLKAIDQFQLARQANANFISYEKIQNYIGDCQATIDAGNSLDSKWEGVKDWLHNIPAWVWYAIAGGLVLLVILIFVIIRQSRWLKKEQDEILLLEGEVSKDHLAQQHSSPIELTVPINPAEISPQLTDYVHQGRQSGMTDIEMHSELLKNGWSQDEIDKALKITG